MIHRGNEGSQDEDGDNALEEDDTSVLADVEVHEQTAPDMQSYTARWILKTRESRSLTRSATQGILEGVQDLVSFVAWCLESQTYAVLQSNGIDCTAVDGLGDVFTGPITTPFQGLTSFYQQLQFFCKNFNLIVSITCSLCSITVWYSACAYRTRE